MRSEHAATQTTPRMSSAMWHSCSFHRAEHHEGQCWCRLLHARVYLIRAEWLVEVPLADTSIEEEGRGSLPQTRCYRFLMKSLTVTEDSPLATRGAGSTGAGAGGGTGEAGGDCETGSSPHRAARLCLCFRLSLKYACTLAWVYPSQPGILATLSARATFCCLDGYSVTLWKNAVEEHRSACFLLVCLKFHDIPERIL